MPNGPLRVFSNTVASHIDCYVYRLIDPRNGETFYVGKGQGNRIFSHARNELALSDLEENEDERTTKQARIRDIRNAGLDVQYVIHRHGLSDSVAFEVEAALLDAYPGTENDQGGHGSTDRGPMHPDEIIAKYDLPAIPEDPEHSLVLINVNRIEDRRDRQRILDQVRFAWRIDKKRAEKADYVLAVYRGIVIGVFVAERWLDATKENFPGLAEEGVPGRWGFVGRVAEEVWDTYVGSDGKRVTNSGMKHHQYPIRYWNLD